MEGNLRRKALTIIDSFGIGLPALCFIMGCKLALGNLKSFPLNWNARSLGAFSIEMDSRKEVRTSVGIDSSSLDEASVTIGYGQVRFQSFLVQE